MNPSRRNFMIVSLGAGSSLLLARAALAAGPKLSEADPAAVAVGYREDVAKVDKARFPTYAAGQACSNCSLFQGKSTDAWGGCTLFGDKEVAARGWCSSYTNM